VYYETSLEWVVGSKTERALLEHCRDAVRALVPTAMSVAQFVCSAPEVYCRTDTLLCRAILKEER
jgi:hypothetical protein